MNEKLLKIQKLAQQHERNGLRRGQSLMNALWEVAPEVYAEINQTDADCFYVDSLVNDCWQEILKRLS